MYRGGGNDRHFSEGIADAAYARYLVNSDTGFIIKQLGIMQHIYNLWMDHFDISKHLYYIEPLLDATEYTISSIDASGGKDGFTGGQAFRPTINSYQYANAKAIASIALLKGDSALYINYLNKAEKLKYTIQLDLWNESFQHFTDRYKVNNKFVHYWDFIRGRELAGYVPWTYNLPDNIPKYNQAWQHITDTSGLLGPYGLRTVEPSYQYYMKQYRYEGSKPECQWNGPSWPFQTSQALLAMANLLNNYTQKYLLSSDYVKILRLYTQQHYLADGQLNLQEDYNPDAGKVIVGLSRSDHYNHSEYNDLIITGLCGLRPSAGNTVIINPLVDSSISYFCLQDILYHGHNLTIVYDNNGSKYHMGKGVTVLVDGKKVNIKKVNGKYEVRIGASLVTSFKPKVNLALNIWRNGYPQPSASVNSNPDSLYQAIDGRSWYFKEIRNRWSTLGSSSVNNWYAIDFGTSKQVSSAKLYFYADDRTYGIPANCNIEYKVGEQWVPVKVTTPLKLIANTCNAIYFNKVSTTQLLINFIEGFQKLATALTEIEVY